MPTDQERLVIALEARIRDFERNMLKASRTGSKAFDDLEARAKKSATRMEQAMSGAATRVGSALKGFGAGFLGGLAAGGLTGIANEIGDIAKSVAEVGDQAKRAGLSTKAFQELAYVAKASRIGVDALTDGMKELNLRADEFITTGGGSAAESFQRLGYSASELKDKLKDPSALFTEIIAKLGQLDKAAQIRIADELFGGTGGEQFVQLIGQGEAGIKHLIQLAHETGSVMDDEMIAKAAALDLKFQQVKDTVGNGLKQAIVEAGSAFADFMKQVEGFLPTIQGLAGDIKLPAGTSVGPGGALVSNVDVLEGQRSQILKDIRITENGINAGIESRLPSDMIAAEQERLSALREQLGVVEEQIRQQQRLNAEKEKTVELDEVIVTSPQVPFSPLPAGDVNRQVQLAAARDQIKRQESAGSGGYRAIGPVTESGDRAYGAYQVMGNNIAEWTKDALGVALTSEQFLNNPDFQDRVFDKIFGGYIDQFGMEGAAQAWFGGPGAVGKTGRTDVLGTSVGEYGSRFAAGVGATGGTSDQWSGMRDVTAGLGAQGQAVDALGQRYTQMGQIGLTAFQGIANALSDGKLDAGELIGVIGQLIQQLLSMPALPTAGTAGAAGGSGASIFGSILSSIFGGGLHLAGGGHVSGPGSATSDSIPAALSNGEFVVNARQTAKHRALLEAINRGDALRLADGGMAGKPLASPIVRGAGSPSFVSSPTINIKMEGNASADPQAQQEQADKIGKAVTEQTRQEMARFAQDNMRVGGMFNQRSFT